MASGFHHLHKRKRIYKNFEEYPSSNKFKRFFDLMAYPAAIIGPFFIFLQLWKIWYFEKATGVSIITWIGIFIGSGFWFLYGVIHKEKPIILTNLLTLIFSFFIIMGTLKFS